MTTPPETESVTVHGTFMSIMDLGVVLTGQSGVGKSELALELINRGHRLVADDAPEFRVEHGGRLMGCPQHGLGDYMEVRGLGVLNMRAMFGDGALQTRARLHLVVNLVRTIDVNFPQIDRLNPAYRELNYLGVAVPEITLPVAPGKNLAVITEAAVRNHKLRRGGYDSAEDFTARQRGALSQKGADSQ